MAALINEELAFYQHFLDMVDEKDDLDPDIQDQFRNPDFRRQIQSHHTDSRLVREVAPYVKPMLKKPQELLADKENYYVAIDLMTNTYYVCFRDLLMIDIDFYKGHQGDEKIEDYLPHCTCQIQQIVDDYRPPEDEEISTPRQTLWRDKKCLGRPSCTLRYTIFKTRNGYHAFVVSHRFDSKSDLALQLMIEAGTDYFYVIFSFLRGWCVRLNRKPGESISESGLYEYHCDVARGQVYQPHMIEDENVTVIEDNCPYPALPELSQMVVLHLNLCDVFAQVSPCLTGNVK
jgi:hypothetical protein